MEKWVAYNYIIHATPERKPKIPESKLALDIYAREQTEHAREWVRDPHDPVGSCVLDSYRDAIYAAIMSGASEYHGLDFSDKNTRVAEIQSQIDYLSRFDLSEIIDLRESMISCTLNQSRLYAAKGSEIRAQFGDDDPLCKYPFYMNVSADGTIYIHGHNGHFAKFEVSDPAEWIRQNVVSADGKNIRGFITAD